MRWMNLEPIVQSEISQKEKGKCCILMHAYGIQKDGTDEPMRYRHREHIVETVGEGEGSTN